MGKWGKRFLQDDAVLDVLDELRGRSGDFEALLARTFLEYQRFEELRARGQNLHAPESEAEIQRLIEADEAFEAIADELRSESIDVGHHEGERLLVVARLMLANLDPPDKDIPLTIRNELVNRFRPTKREIEELVSVLALLRDNVERWPDDLADLRMNLVIVEERIRCFGTKH